MKFFVGIPIPKQYKRKIEMLRAEFKFFTTEPHITLVPPPVLEDNDMFISDLIKICKKTDNIKIILNSVNQFGNRVLYVSVESSGLIAFHNKIYEALDIKEEKTYIPHLTVVKKRPRRPIDILRIRSIAEKELLPAPSFTIKAITVYQQPKKNSIYIPYMVIPLGS